MTYAAFDYAQRDRNPVLILADGVLGTIMEPVELPEMRSDEEVKRLKDELSDWALVGHSARQEALCILPGGWAGQEDQVQGQTPRSVRYMGEGCAGGGVHDSRTPS